MLNAYRATEKGLVLMAPSEPIADADWIDILDPSPEETAEVDAIVPEVPSFEDMREIEISNRLYREGESLYATVLIPGLDRERRHISGPVTFILMPGGLVTLRYHTPRPFETYPTRAEQATPGCANATQVLLGLMEEITGRQADLLEGVSTSLDIVSGKIFHPGGPARQSALQEELRRIGLEGELIGRVRLGLLSMARALNFLRQVEPQTFAEGLNGETVAALIQDITALEVHGDFLNQRIAMTNDVILGLINIAQAQTTKIVSVVAVLFSPPMLIASIYGMNFAAMPELDWSWGYPAAIIAMIGTAVCSYLLFRWLRWL